MKPIQQTIPLALPTIVLALLNSLTCPAATLLVWQGSPSPAPPYATWATAATNIQDAIDAAAAGDVVVVTNGVYASGGQGSFGITNRIALLKPVTVRSVGGPAVTIIRSQEGVRCALLTNGAVLTGFTLTNGVLREELGAGVVCVSGNSILASTAVVSNCVVSGNSTHGSGGGAAGGTLYNCVLTGNQAQDDGGGAYLSTLNNCTLAGNWSNDGGGGAYGCTLTDCLLTDNHAPEDGGGGAFNCTLNRCTLTRNSAENNGGGGASNSRLDNCLLVGNSAGIGGGAAACVLNNCTVTKNSAGLTGGAAACTMTNCIVDDNFATNRPNYLVGLNTFIAFTCTTPLPEGIGNITNKPVFVNAAAGDYHLRHGSPGIDAGTDLSESIATDLDGNARPLDGNRDGVAAFDMGAYEFNGFYFTSITRVGNSTLLCWFDTPAGMKLQAAPALNNPLWTDVPFAPGTNCVELLLNSSNTFYRLVKP